MGRTLDRMPKEGHTLSSFAFVGTRQKDKKHTLRQPQRMCYVRVLHVRGNDFLFFLVVRVAILTSVYQVTAPLSQAKRARYALVSGILSERVIGRQVYTNTEAMFEGNSPYHFTCARSRKSAQD